MDSSIITVTARMLQIANFNLHTECVTNLGLTIWLPGDLLGVLYSWWTFFDCAGVATDNFIVTVTICILHIASFNSSTEGATNLGLAIWLLGDVPGVLYSRWTFFDCAGVAMGILLSQ